MSSYKDYIRTLEDSEYLISMVQLKSYCGLVMRQA